jgi:hypothetical protein
MHLFRLTDITTYLEKRVNLEIARRIVRHVESRTTQAYDDISVV